MSSVQCWECEEEFGRNKVFDIPVFKAGWTVKWCFNCAMKQLEWSDYRLIPKPEKYKKFKIKSFQDRRKLDSFYLDELLKCYKLQFEEDLHHINSNEEDWRILRDISWNIVNEGEDEE